MCRWCSYLASGDPSSTKCSGTQTASEAAVMALSVIFEPLVAGDQKASLASLSP